MIPATVVRLYHQSQWWVWSHHSGGCGHITVVGVVASQRWVWSHHSGGCVIASQRWVWSHHSGGCVVPSQQWVWLHHRDGCGHITVVGVVVSSGREQRMDCIDTPDHGHVSFPSPPHPLPLALLTPCSHPLSSPPLPSPPRPLPLTLLTL